MPQKKKKAANKQQATSLVQHKTPNLSALLELAAHA
jgi:hypothetical protein